MRNAAIMMMFAVSFSLSSNLFIVSQISETHIDFSFPQRSSCSICIQATYIPFDQHRDAFLQIQLSKKTLHKFQTVYLSPILISSSYTERKSVFSRYIEKYHHPKYFLPSIFPIIKSFLNDVPTSILSRYTSQRGGRCDSYFVRTYAASSMFTGVYCVACLFCASWKP